MHSLSRLGSAGAGVNSTPSPSVSPPSSPRYRHSRSKNVPASGDASGDFGVGGAVGFPGGCAAGGGGHVKLKLHILVERFGFVVVSTVYRWRRVLLLAPLLYITGMLLYMGTLSVDSIIYITNGRGYAGDFNGPGSVYRSPQVFEKLWPFMQAESSGSYNLLINVWTSK